MPTKKMNPLWVILVIAGVTLSGSCAFREDLIAVNNRVIALEKREASLRSDVERYKEDQAGTDQDSRSSHAELRALANDVRDEMGKIRGDLELGQHSTRRLEESLQTILARVVRIEQYLGMEPFETPVALDTGQDELEEEEETVEETPEALYAAARQSFEKGEYEKARELFRSFLKKYPESEKADSAQFWLGEIYYHEKWYEKAIVEYQKVIENSPKGKTTPSALLKQGLAFLNLGDNANAKHILNEVILRFPDSNEANVAKNKLKTLK